MKRAYRQHFVTGNAPDEFVICHLVNLFEQQGSVVDQSRVGRSRATRYNENRIYSS